MKKKIKFYVYKISTPILEKKKSKKSDDFSYISNYFNYNILLYCIKAKEINTRLKRIRTFDKSKTIVLEKFEDKYDENFSFGEFLTIAHGVKATSIEIKKLTKTKDFEENEGIVNKVKFFIDKRNGYIYVEHDRNAVITMKKIQSYFSEMSNRKSYYEEFNKINIPFYQLDTHRRFINTTLLEPLDFIEQIKNIKKIYDIEIPLNIEGYQKEKNGVLSSLRERANENEVGEHKAKIVLEDFNFKKMSKELLNFIKFLQENELYENLKVKGSLNSNIPRVFTPETSTKDIMFETEKDVSGWANTDLVFNNLKNIINEDEQLNVIFNTGDVKAVDIKKCLLNLMKDKLYKNLRKLGYTNLKNRKLIMKK
ncbi:hypothetical protein ACWEZE_01205 [Staphylococcus shinii]|uniref:hypothetical protein n=1 Tax=Staphylococcus shinii TaxID=2912228 RepID=UPI000C323F99|nr:hypothetical protein [Staphylococcus shinii]PKI09764.1 hypothetical protein CW747_05400 [Staphylococcus shinii]